MKRPPPLGSIGCFVTSRAKMGRKHFVFDGTVKGLTNASLANGAVVGSIVQADFGGGFQEYIIEAAPHDTRCNGFWATRR